MTSRIPSPRSQSQITIRPAIESDIPQIAAIGKSNFTEANVSELRLLHRISRGHSFFIAEMDGKVVGFIDLRLGLKGVLISGLATRHGFRRKGIGTALLDYAINFAKKKRKLDIELRVAATNLKALSLYKKHGFFLLNRKTGRDGIVIYRMIRLLET